MVFDVTSPPSFFNLASWNKEVRRAIPGVPIAVIANKSDQEAIVPLPEAQGWATMQGYPFIATSAKTGENVDAMFRGLAQLAHQHLKELESMEETSFGTNSTQTFE